MSKESDLSFEDLDDEAREEQPEVSEPKIDPRTLLTQRQIEQYKEVFVSLDVQGKGKLPVKSIGRAIRALGWNPREAEIRKCIEEIDPDGKGYADFYGFLLPIAQRLEEVPETYEEVVEAFEVFDPEGKGYVRTRELVQFLTTLGESLEDFEIETLVKSADAKGKINYADFVAKMMGIEKKGKGKEKDGRKSKILTSSKISENKSSQDLKFSRIKIFVNEFRKMADEPKEDEEIQADDESASILAEIAECFFLFDKNRAGKMESKNFESAMRALGVFLTETEIEDAMQTIDKKGKISFEDFCSFASEKMGEIDEVDQLKRAFGAFDPENEGTVPTDRFKRRMIHLGNRLKDEETREFCKLGDPAGKGVIPYEDLIALLISDK